MTARYILLALLFVDCSSGENACTLHHLQGCLESLQSVTQGSDLALAATLQELETVCVSMESSVGCVDEHMRNCFTSTQIQVFNQVVSGARQFLRELCVPGKTQEAYLRHSLCYRNVTLLEEKCAPKYRRLVQLSERVDNQKDVDEGLRQSCCAFNAFVQCKHIYAKKDCGQEASNFLQQHLDRISNPLIHEHCEHYTHAQDACTLSGSAHSPNYQPPLETFAIIFLLCIVVYLPTADNMKF